MNAERWQRAKQIFCEAIELKAADREQYVLDASRGDSLLVDEVLRLLHENDRDTGLLSEPALILASELPVDDAPRFAPSAVLARRFRIIRFIARGGMAEVYEAEDVELGERVALKAIRRSIASDATLRAGFKREVQLARRITHANVCRIFDLVQHEEPTGIEPVLLLSMELLNGITLAEYLRLNKPVDLRSALPLIGEIAAGLQAVHDAGIIHGDLKPGNIMLVFRSGQSVPHAKVMDFGVALPTNAVAALDESAVRRGTPDYLAPEQLRGEPASAASDIYAFGLVISEMLGVRSNCIKPELRELSSRWRVVLGRCLDADSSRRYRRPADVASAMRGASGVTSRKGWTALALVCVVAALLIALSRVDHLRHPNNLQILNESSALDIWRASPDGKSLVATSWDTGDLVLEDVSTGKVRRLTRKTTDWQTHRAGAYGALFSPDGHQIAYEWSNSSTDHELRLIGTDGKNERRFFHDANLRASLLDWSPDGRQLLIWLRDINGAGNIGVLSRQNGSVRLLRKQPSLAPGGQVIFARDSGSVVFDYRGARNDDSEIHRLTLNGDESVMLAHTGASQVIGWSPDGHRLIFSSDRRGEPGIWAVSVSSRGAESEAAELVPNARDWESLGLSRTGSIFYRYDASSLDVYTSTIDVDRRRMISPPRRITERFVGSFSFPNWSEDGTQLLFVSTKDRSTPVIGIADARTGVARELQTSVRFPMRPQWVDHGASVMAIGIGKDETRGLFRIDPQTVEARLFNSLERLEVAYEGVWSPDGRYYFNRYLDFRRGIFRLDLTTGDRRVLYVPPHGTAIGMENIAISPDGRKLAFHSRNEAEGTSSLMLMSSDGGEARSLFVLKQPESFPFGSFTWTPDSKRILAVRDRSLDPAPAGRKASEIWIVPAEGGAPQQIEFPTMAISCIRMNPDGRTIAFQVHQDARQIWVLQNFL